MKKMFGVSTAMLTPLNEYGEVMVPELEQYVDFLISKGVHCLYPLGSMGEMNLLTVPQRKIVAETVVKKTDHRVPVFVHVGAIRYEDTLELASHALEIGADGIGAVTPSYWPFKENEIIKFYQLLSASLPKNFPIYMYNIPQYSTIDLTTKMVKEIVDTCENIVGIKYSVGNMARTQEYIEVNKNFSVLQGGDLLMTLALSLGCEGVISGYSAAFPEYFVRIYDAYLANDLQTANKYQKEITHLTSFLKKELSTIPKLKAYLNLRGINVGVAKQPFLMPDQQQLSRLKLELTKFSLL